MSKRIKNVKWVNGIAHGRKTYKGKEYLETLETTCPRVAAQRVKKWLDDLKGEGWKGKAQRTTEEALALARRIHWPRITKSTQQRYEVSIGQMSFLAGKRLDDITPVTLMNFEAERRAAGTSAPTIRRDLQALSVIYETAIDAEWTDRNPAKTYLKRAAKNGLREHAPKSRIASYAESADLVMGALRMPRHDDHIRTMLAAYIIIKTETGLRANELLQMRARWIDLDRRMEMFVPKEIAKRNKARRVPLRPLARETLRRLLAVKPCPGGEDYLFWREGTGRPFQGFWYAFQDAVNAAGIMEDITLHDLRRTCGARLLREGVSIEVVSSWLGHSDIKVTQRHYAFLNVDSLHRAVGTIQVEEDRPEISLTFLEQNTFKMVVEDAQVIERIELSVT
jgi:integrase